MPKPMDIPFAEFIIINLAKFSRNDVSCAKIYNYTVT